MDIHKAILLWSLTVSGVWLPMSQQSKDSSKVNPTLLLVRISGVPDCPTSFKERKHIETGNSVILALAAVGVSSQSLHNFKFSFGFCQLFGQAKDYGETRIHEKILSGSLYTEYSTELLPILKFLAGTSVFKPKILKQAPEDFLVKFQSQSGYFYGDNSMKVRYSDGTQTHSSWENHCYSGDIGTSITLPIKSKDGHL